MNKTCFVGKCLYMNLFAKLQTLRHRLAAKTSSCSVKLFSVNWNSQVYNRPLIFHCYSFGGAYGRIRVSPRGLVAQTFLRFSSLVCHNLAYVKIEYV
jgi:hypothetical protein